MKDLPRIGFIGGGNMAGALIEGLLAQGCAPEGLMVLDVSDAVLERWHKRGLNTAAVASTVLSECEVWVLAVKPQQLHAVTQTLKPFLKDGTLVISIAAGISVSSLSEWMGQGACAWPGVIRAMPNTPSLVGKGVTGLAASPTVSEAQRTLATRILGGVGEVVWVENDEQIDVVTAISGSGPAYVFRFIESLIQAAEQLGLEPQQARSLALATVQGAAELAARSEDSVSTLRENVTSKGGTTAAALDVLQSGGFLETIGAAVQAAYNRAGELSKEYGQPNK